MQCEIRIKLKDDNGAAFGGIGSIWLLENIQSYGSVRAAAAAMELSYPKALKLLKNLEDNLGYQVVARTKGGAARGGAELTPAGLLFLEEFRKFYAKVQQATDREAALFWNIVQKSKALLMLLILAVLPLTACSAKEGQGAAPPAGHPMAAAVASAGEARPPFLGAANTRQVIDSAGRNVAVSVNIRKIAAAGPVAAALLYAIAPEKMAGWSTKLAPESLALLPENVRGLPVIGRLSGRGGTASYEQFLRYGVDLVIDYGDIGPTYISLADRVQAQTGLPYLLLDGSLEKAPETLALLAQILGREAAAESQIEQAQMLLSRAAALRETFGAKGRPPVFYLAKGSDGLESAGDGAIHAALLRLLGFKNAIPRSTQHGLVRISFEELLNIQPDYIVTNDYALYEKLRSEPMWQGLKAIKEGHLFVAPEHPFGWLDSPPGINRLMGIPWLLQISGNMSKEEALAMLSSFHRAFLHIEMPAPAAGVFR